MRKVLLLDTGGTCFLCLKESTNDDDDEMTGIGIVCLQKICRYLNINQCSVILKGLKDAGRQFTEEEKEEAIRQGNNCDFSVKICLTCLPVASHLSELLEQLEMTKMMIRQRIEQFHQISQFNEDHQGRLTKELIKSGKIVEAHFVKTLREESIKQSSEKVKDLQTRSYPRVRLTKLKSSPLITSPPSPETNFIDHASPSPELNDCISLEQTSGNSITTSSSASGFIPAIMTIKSGATRKQIHKGGDTTAARFDPHRIMVRERCKRFFRETELPNEFECSLCKKRFVKFSIDRHIVGRHPEVVFENIALPHLSPEKFRECCKTAMETVVKSARQKVGSSSMKQFFCKLCNNNQIMKISMVNFRHHLSMEHYDAVAEVVWKVQGGPPEVFASSRNGRIAYCNSTDTSHEESREAFQLPGSYVNTSKDLKIWACHLSKGGCGWGFLSETQLNLHKENECPNTRKGKKEGGNQSLVAFDPHRIMVRERCNRFFSETGLPNESQCSLCKKRCLRYTICSHIVVCHPEVVFENLALPDISQDKFREYCKAGVETVVKSARQRVGSLPMKQYFCNLCKNNQRMMMNFRYHLAMEHYDAVAEVVWKLQGGSPQVFTNTSKQASQEECHPIWTCNFTKGGCGSRFSSELQLHLHKKNECPNKWRWKSEFVAKPTTKHFVCNLAMGGCGIRFTSAKNLRRHKMYSCPHRKIQQKVLCDSSYGGCGKFFPTMIHLKQHCQRSRSRCPLPNSRISHENVIQKPDPHQDAQIAIEIEHDAQAIESFVKEEVDSSNYEVSAVPIIVDEMVCDLETKTETVEVSMEDAADDCNLLMLSYSYKI